MNHKIANWDDIYKCTGVMAYHKHVHEHTKHIRGTGKDHLIEYEKTHYFEVNKSNVSSGGSHKIRGKIRDEMNSGMFEGNKQIYWIVPFWKQNERKDDNHIKAIYGERINCVVFKNCDVILTFRGNSKAYFSDNKVGFDFVTLEEHTSGYKTHFEETVFCRKDINKIAQYQGISQFEGATIVPKTKSSNWSVRFYRGRFPHHFFLALKPRINIGQPVYNQDGSDMHRKINALSGKEFYDEDFNDDIQMFSSPCPHCKLQLYQKTNFKGPTKEIVFYQLDSNNVYHLRPLVFKEYDPDWKDKIPQSSKEGISSLKIIQTNKTLCNIPKNIGNAIYGENICQHVLDSDNWHIIDKSTMIGGYGKMNGFCNQDTEKISYLNPFLKPGQKQDIYGPSFSNLLKPHCKQYSSQLFAKKGDPSVETHLNNVFDKMCSYDDLDGEYKKACGCYEKYFTETDKAKWAKMREKVGVTPQEKCAETCKGNGVHQWPHMDACEYTLCMNNMEVDANNSSVLVKDVPQSCNIKQGPDPSQSPDPSKPSPDPPQSPDPSKPSPDPPQSPDPSKPSPESTDDSDNKFKITDEQMMIGGGVAALLLLLAAS